LPPLQAAGKIEFNEHGVNLNGVGASFLGGPLALSGGTQRDGASHPHGRQRPPTACARRPAAGAAAPGHQAVRRARFNGTVTVRTIRW
jgi:hypothetical protein